MKIRNDHRISGAEPRLFPDARNMPKPHWRRVLTALAGPAVRVHKYRNLRGAMFHDAMDDVDCRDE
ncbi:MAG: hypothetical protein R3358_13375 [Woeseiaceae bacterium]|nr:hypothetical protein [Woeseiaceae bacterium]